MKFYVLITLVISCFTPMTQASCDSIFNSFTDSLYIPEVLVGDSESYSVKLQRQADNSFLLSEATAIKSADPVAQFLPVNNKLIINSIDVAGKFYTADLLLQTNTNPLLFTLDSFSLLNKTLSNPLEELPCFESLALFSEESPFNQKIPDNPAIDPNSDNLILSLMASTPITIEVKQFSQTVFFANEDTPRHDVKLNCGPVWELGIETLVDVPIPDWAVPTFDSEAEDDPPIGCGEGSDQDNHMVILDLNTRCAYDFWQAAKDDAGNWVASWANAIPMDSNGIFEHGLSARGSGFALLGGVIWPDELVKGHIKHRLIFNYPFPKAGGPVAPATDSDGTSTNINAMPEGAIVQLDPKLNLDELNLTDYETTIARALQEYGMMLVDFGGTVASFQVVDPNSLANNPYTGLLPDEVFVDLNNLIVNAENFRVLKLPPQNSNWEDQLALVGNHCVTMK